MFKNSYEVDKVITDAKTGFLIAEVYENDKLNLIRAKDLESDKAIEYRRRREEWEQFEKLINAECGSFYFNFLDGELNNLQIKESIKARFLYLYTYTTYSNSGSYLMADNNVLMTKEVMMQKLNLSDREFRGTLKNLLETGLIIQNGDYYLTNTHIAKRGSLTTIQKKKSYTRMFDDGIRSLYENCKVSQHKQLYYLFKLLPYVNIKFNVVCANPTETIAEHVIPLNMKQMCELITGNSQNANRIKKELYKLQLFNQYAMLGVENANGMWYKINPKVSYGGTGGHLNEFMELLGADFGIKL